ncbi:coiled-coil domain-containing protein [Paenibacillus harenae]|uniref:coiled-coil domain-containing protein n=1 Tax=Paenibacillus harenae TaxID=306543 RepID=UPI002794AD4E|nr:hypothetical protein [Paenibacillus harenae]MDQ0059385.1 Skp family chaperone for outer membrane proteins [Paenibacillus harenae]
MRQPTIRRRIAVTGITALIMALLLIRLPVSAEPQPEVSDDIHSVLETSLSVVEIDKEIGRIQEEKQALLLSMADKEQQLAEQQEKIESKREQAGSVLRAYYMGERDFLFTALLSANSLSDLFQIIDYADILITHDKHTLNGYAQQYEKMKEGYEQLKERQIALGSLEERLQTQRSRVLALEQQLDEQLEGRSDAERLRLMIGELTSFWETEGLKEVKQYFSELSKAMQKLPSWIQDNKTFLEIEGFNYTLRVPQDDLNAFLREQNEMFERFAFTFEDGKVTATGKSDNLEISITGSYTVQVEPANGIIFHVEELLFNGFKLPDTTRNSLEEEFDLGFYPGLIISFLEAKSVEIKDGELIVKLSLSL